MNNETPARRVSDEWLAWYLKETPDEPKGERVTAWDLCECLRDERQHNAALVAELAGEAERVRQKDEAMIHLIASCQDGPSFALTKPKRRLVEQAKAALALTPTQAEARATENARKADILDALLDPTLGENGDMLRIKYYSPGSCNEHPKLEFIEATIQRQRAAHQEAPCQS